MAEKSKTTFIKIDMKPVQTILKNHGLDENGHVQKKLTAIVNHRITRYMPYLTGTLAMRSKRITSPTEIRVEAPYARYTYFGKVMEGLAPKKATGIDLIYTKTPHPDAGPYWDRRLMAAESKAIAKEVEEYIKRG